MNTPDTIAKKIAQDLLDIRAVFFRPEEPFLWASGIKSPVYCDNRLTLTAPQVRDDVERAMAETIRREYPGAEVLMGTATAGIAHAAITAHLLGLPMGYVRAGQKDHGRQNQIEGRLEKGRKVVVVEDLISTGGSVIEVVEALRAAGAEVLGVVSIFTYGMKQGLDRLAAARWIKFWASSRMAKRAASSMEWNSMPNIIPAARSMGASPITRTNLVFWPGRVWQVIS